jgi:hypothetical protein
MSNLQNPFPGTPGVPPADNPLPPQFSGDPSADAGVSAGVDFPPSPKASICGFSFGLPRFKFSFHLPSIPFPPPLPSFSFGFKLTCSLPNPVDVTAKLNLPYGGGRTFNAPPNPDDNDASP